MSHFWQTGWKMKRKNTIMKMHKFILSVSLLALIIMAAACQKDEKPSVGLTLKATGASEPSGNATSKEPIFTTPGNSSNEFPLQLTWNDAWIYITRLEFSANLISPSIGEIKLNPDVHVEWQGYQKVDLIGDTKIFAILEIPDGNYQDIALSMTSARINDMIQPNFYFAGIYGPVFGGTPIAVAISQGFTINMKFEDGTINAQSGNFLDGQIEVSIDNLFNGISAEDLNKADLTDGAILISATYNQDLYMKILANLQLIYFNENTGQLTWNFHIKPD